METRGFSYYTKRNNGIFWKNNGIAISEVLTEEYPYKLTRLSIKDTFGKTGKAEKLMDYFGITARSITENI